jgi:hypothetical protein
MSKENVKEKEKLVVGSGWGLTPRLTGRLTVGRNKTSTVLSYEVTIFLSGVVVQEIVSN